MNKTIAPNYIRQNFQPTDPIAVVLINKSTGAKPEQRIASAEQIASDRFQAFLRAKNAQKYEVYISMNTLRPGSFRRTKADIAEIRHIYLDFDHHGREAVAALRTRKDVPPPNFIIESSPGKYQVIWKVQGFNVDQAEALMRRMVREFGADPAATDSTRVMRLPATYNHKYATPHFVSVVNVSLGVSRADEFEGLCINDKLSLDQTTEISRVGMRAGGLSQSEKDWAFVKSALASGEPAETIIGMLSHQRFDKANPVYYARLTVFKAQADLAKTKGIRTAEGYPEPNHR